MEPTDTAENGQTKQEARPSANAHPNSNTQQMKKPKLSSTEKQRIADEKQTRINDERKRALHPQTGTESEQLWSITTQRDSAVQLLDLDLAWNELADGLPVTVPNNEPEIPQASVDNQNAALLVRELKGYVIATCSNEQPKRDAKDDQPTSDRKGDQGNEDDGEQAEWLAPIPDMAQPIVPEDQGDCDQDESLKSTYGSSILLKLQWEYREPQKEVPEMDYHQLALFISDITINLNDAFDKNPTASQVVLDLIALDMTPLLLARYISAIETEHADLAQSSFNLLKLCATNANPKEMHISIKTFLSKIDRIYTEATSYLCLHPLIELWADIIPRVKTKRKPLLADMVKHVERMLASGETYEASFVPEDGFGVERPGRLLGIPDVLLDFYEKLVSVQQKQAEIGTDIRVVFDCLGRPKPALNEFSSDVVNSTGDNDQKPEGREAGDTDKGGTKPEVDNSQGKQGESVPPAAHEDPAERSGFERKAAAAVTKENSAEWIRERAITLAKVLNLFGMLWMRLPAPAGEATKTSKKKKKRMDGSSKEMEVSLKTKEESVERCLKLFPALGWSNPILACQLATDGMSLIHTGRAGELMKKHIGYEGLSKKDMKNATYSLNSVGFYISGLLRHITMKTDEHGKAISAGEGIYTADAAFDLLSPLYSFDLVLPFLLPTIGHSNLAVSVRGILTLGAFLRKLPDKAFATLEDVLRLRCGTGSGGRNVNILGLLQGLSRALRGLNDRKHRKIAYEAIQTILRKCASPVARYAVTECLYFNPGGSVISAQFMTELKDAIMYSDSIASPSRKDKWSWMQASRLRWRFAQDCFTRNFLPRKELLSYRDQLLTAASLHYFLVARDKKLIDEFWESDADLLDDVMHRQRFLKTYGKLGKDCIRALASVAEHDRKNIPSSALAKKNVKDAVAIYQVSGLTLSQCVCAISFLDAGLELISAF